MTQRRIERRRPRVEDRFPPELHPVLRQVYRNRGLAEPADTDLSLSCLLPFTGLKGLEQAVQLLVEALNRRWHICVVGDYDADGATSTALMLSLLRHFGAHKVSYLVPDRFRYGYGLSPDVVKQASLRQPDLLVTVDNGIASIDGVNAAHEAGMRVLVTDHHLPGKHLPAADAIVNPNQPGCDFPSKSLAGVGVSFYLLLALRARLRELGRDDLPNMANWLDLVSLGTVADVVPLDRNNRILVEHGLRLLRAGRGRPGLQALIQVAGRDEPRLSASDLGFAVAPRLNAAGRLDDMGVGIECLLSSDVETAARLARQLDSLNQERRAIQQQMQDEALAGLALPPTESLPLGLCVYDHGWHQGVTGLVAGKIKDRYHRPTIAFAPADEQGSVLKGSARSIPGLHIRDVLDAIATRYPGLLAKFGGHAMAAGLSLEYTRLEDFRRAFDEEVQRWIDPSALQGVVESDGELGAGDLSLGLATVLEAAGPWGQGFPEPVFDGEFEVIERRIVAERHLKFRLRPVSGQALYSAIAFNQLGPAEPGERIHAAFKLGINDYRGQRKAEAVIEYFEVLA